MSSDRLLARLGVLRCGSCGARLGAMKLPRQDDYPIYRCPSWSECDHHATISAEIAEDVVTAAVRDALADEEGRASAAMNAHEAATALEQAQSELDAATRVFTAAAITDESAAVGELSELRRVRDAAQEHVDQISGDPTELTMSAAGDWDRLSVDARRALIRATVARAIVAAGGRGADRITVELLGQ